MNTSSYSAATLQRGSAPAGTRTIALPMSIVGPMSWLNHDINAHSLMLFPANQELFSISKDAMQIATVSIADNMFDSQLDQIAIAPTAGLDDARLTQIDPAQWQHLHKCLQTISDYAENYQHKYSDSNFERYLAEETAFHLIRAAIGDLADRCRAPVHTAAKHTRTALKYIIPRLNTPLTVAEVCDATGIGRRTMEQSLRRYLGLSPKQVITFMRYSRCREALIRTNHPTVQSTAHAWGFWHMGQFSKDYKRLFGESPRDTLKRR